MIEAPTITIKLDSAGSSYQPGQRIGGHFMIDGAVPWPVRSAELSILWYTAGQGEEDFAVHSFERYVDEPGRALDLRLPRSFATVLPQSPMSYNGRIVKVCWCVRLRIYPHDGPETLDEVAFRLGDVPAAPPEG